MHEEALEIHKYLPIRTSQIENDYIMHLWSVFMVIDDSIETAKPFMVMPFHLMFMMALQYKALRISREIRNNYELVFTFKTQKDCKKLLRPTSVFDFSLLQERALPDLFRLINLDDVAVKKIKDLVDCRNNNLAHATGGIAYDYGAKIVEYLDCLKDVQNKFKLLNDAVGDCYDSGLMAEDDKKEFIEIRLLDSCLCPADFLEGRLNKTFGFVGSYV